MDDAVGGVIAEGRAVDRAKHDTIATFIRGTVAGVLFERIG